jgi:hypothetical protein
MTSTNLKEVQGFVKFVSFYRCFIKDFSKLVKPFTQVVGNRKQLPQFPDMPASLSPFGLALADCAVYEQHV